MLVLNLSCVHGHLFEGWFGSNDDYLSQHERAMISCPMCGVDQVTRLPSAPRLNVSHLRERDPMRQALPSSGDGAAAMLAAPSEQPVSRPTDSEDAAAPPMHSMWKQLVEHVLKNTEDVGDKFAEEARRIHYGETEQRGIRGSATLEDTVALLDEGIEVMPLNVPVARKGPLQ